MIVASTPQSEILLVLVIVLLCELETVSWYELTLGTSRFENRLYDRFWNREYGKFYVFEI